MDRDLRTFKHAAAQAASVLHANYGQFARTRGMHDFIIDHFGKGLSPQAIAAKAMAVLCEKDGSVFDDLVCLLVVEFLGEMVGRPVDEHNQRLRDLVSIRDNPGTHAAYEQWATSWY